MPPSNTDHPVPARKQTVLLVEDHPVLREGLTKLINGEEDLAVCAEAQNPTAALQAIRDLHPDANIVDLALPEGHGLELIKDIRARQHRMPILVFTMFDDASYSLRVLRAGAQGFLNKRESSERLLSSLRTVLRGGYAVAPDVAKLFLESSLRPAPVSTDPKDCLGDRELEVFQLLGTGIGTREIARQLGRSIKTVETYRARIKRKLNLKNASALVREAVRWVDAQRLN